MGQDVRGHLGRVLPADAGSSSRAGELGGLGAVLPADARDSWQPNRT
ncbi:hypothetical protein [Streptomyces massasporeus]